MGSNSFFRKLSFSYFSFLSFFVSLFLSFFFVISHGVYTLRDQWNGRLIYFREIDTSVPFNHALDTQEAIMAWVTIVKGSERLIRAKNSGCVLFKRSLENRSKRQSVTIHHVYFTAFRKWHDNQIKELTFRGVRLVSLSGYDDDSYLYRTLGKRSNESYR